MQANRNHGDFQLCKKGTKNSKIIAKFAEIR